MLAVVDLLRILRLPHMCSAAPELLATAKAQRWEPSRGHAGPPHRGARRPPGVLGPGSAQGGRVPDRGDLRVWDETLSSIPATTQRALRTLEWVDRHENLVVFGPSGKGKTHFLEALGQACVDAGHKVSWFSLEHLGAVVRRHADPPAKRSSASCAPTSSSSTTSASCP